MTTLSEQDITFPASTRAYERGELPAPWPEVFFLMWEAYLAGTTPVGAVVVDEAGDVVSRGRRR